MADRTYPICLIEKYAPPLQRDYSRLNHATERIGVVVDTAVEIGEDTEISRVRAIISAINPDQFPYDHVAAIRLGDTLSDQSKEQVLLGIASTVIDNIYPIWDATWGQEKSSEKYDFALSIFENIDINPDSRYEVIRHITNRLVDSRNQNNYISLSKLKETDCLYRALKLQLQTMSQLEHRNSLHYDDAVQILELCRNYNLPIKNDLAQNITNDCSALVVQLSSFNQDPLSRMNNLTTAIRCSSDPDVAADALEIAIDSADEIENDIDSRLYEANDLAAQLIIEHSFASSGIGSLVLGRFSKSARNRKAIIDDLTERKSTSFEKLTKQRTDLQTEVKSLETAVTEAVITIGSTEKGQELIRNIAFSKDDAKRRSFLIDLDKSLNDRYELFAKGKGPSHITPDVIKTVHAFLATLKYLHVISHNTVD